MATHAIEPTRETLHGCFSRDLPPVLTVEPGDRLRVRTLEAGWGLEPHRADGGERAQFAPRDPVRDAGHALCGPIAVRGAEPGMALAVRIETLRPGGWGSTIAGGWDSPLNRRLGVHSDADKFLLRWELDRERLTGRDQFGHDVALSPFLGVIGLAPGEPGFHPTGPPRRTGGNIDCKELVAGSTLYLPVEVPGALLSLGDGHALQADGEASSTAIECPMDAAEVTLDRVPDPLIAEPWAETPVGTLTFGLHEDLDEAMARALEAMLTVLAVRHGLGRLEALALASLVVDLRITQVVNGVRGVHAVLPHAVGASLSRGG